MLLTPCQGDVTEWNILGHSASSEVFQWGITIKTPQFDMRLVLTVDVGK